MQVCSICGETMISVPGGGLECPYTDYHLNDPYQRMIAREIDDAMKSFDPYDPNYYDNPDDVFIDPELCPECSEEMDRDNYINGWICPSCKHTDYDKK